MIIKKYYSYILLFLIILTFILIILSKKSDLTVLSIFIDNVKIQNSNEIINNGISFGDGDDDIYIDFINEKRLTIYPNDTFELADNVICLLNDELLNSYSLSRNDTICIYDSTEIVSLVFKNNRIWENDKELIELKKVEWRSKIYPLSSIRDFNTSVYSFIFFDNGSFKILFLDEKDKLILSTSNGKKYYKNDKFYIELKNINRLQFRKIFERYVSYIDKDTKKLISEKKVFQISSIKKDFDVSFNSKTFNINFVKPVKQNIRFNEIQQLKYNSVVLTFGSLSHYGPNIWVPKFVGKISDLGIRLDFKTYSKKDSILVMDPHITKPEQSTYRIPFGKLTLNENGTEIDIWIIKLSLPWHLIVYYLGIFSLFVLLYYQFFKKLYLYEQKSVQHLLLLITVCLIFLSFRLLFSYKAFIQYPFRVDLYRDAIFGLILVPFIILELSENNNSFWRTFLRALVLLIPCSIYLLKLSQLSTEILGIEIFKGKLFGLAILMLLFHPIKFIIYKFYEFFGKLSFSLITSVFILFLIFFIRFLFIKESILGIRASLLANFIAIGIFFGFIRNYFNRNEFNSLNSLKILTFTFLFFLLNAIFSRDHGYLIYFISIPMIFIYIGILSKENKIRNICISYGVIFSILLIIGIFYIGHIMYYFVDLERVGLLTTYETRLLGFADFHLLKSLGYRTTEIFSQFFEKIRYYASSGIFGRGYLNSPIGIESNWFNDNVPSAFLMSEFGLIGVLVIFIFYGFILTIIIPGYRSIFDSYGTRYKVADWKLLGVIASCILILPSVYMIFANVGLVPFTGKNVFLFGLDSYSDLMESAILFGFIAKGIIINKIS